jgi:tyrosinase
MANFSKPQSVTTMLFAFLAFLQFTAAFQHGAHHEHARHSASNLVGKQLDDINSELAKRQQAPGFTAITGVCDAGTNNDGVCNNGRSSAPRLEVRELQKNADQWNLYLLGMERFKAKDKNDRLSYYAVVGA